MAETERPAKSVNVQNIKQGPTNMRHDNRRRYSKDNSGEKQDLNTHALKANQGNDIQLGK